MKTTIAKLILPILALGLQALLFSGCASGFTRSPMSKDATAFKPSAASPIAEVNIELTPSVKEKLKDSLKFDRDNLRKTIELALSNKLLFDSGKKASNPTLHITVTHVRVRNTFNAVMWGAMSGNDAIEGEVVVEDRAGAVMDRFTVKASYALGGWAGGQDSMRMGWLYEAFAKEVVRAFTDEPKKD